MDQDLRVRKQHYNSIREVCGQLVMDGLYPWQREIVERLLRKTSTSIFVNVSLGKLPEPPEGGE